jgi:hypothetical protein
VPEQIFRPWKLQSSHNAVLHSLTASTVVTAIDDAEKFKRP